MMDSESVITHATKGIVEELKDELEVKLGRMYELLGKDCSYPKAKRLIRAIGHADKSPNKDRVRLIKADLDAMFEHILGSEESKIDVVELHRESSEAVQSVLEDKPKAEQMNELRQMIASAQKALSCLEKDEIRRDLRLAV